MKALLMLEDGFHLYGESFTGSIEFAGGEAIFNTSMTGYQEILTDPSYSGQVVCMTWPLIGNYGINDEDMESAGLHLNAFVVKECCKKPSNWRSVQSLPEFLKKNNIPGIEAIDTRAFTLHLREQGAMRAGISTEILDPEKLLERIKKLPSMEGQNLMQKVAPKEAYTWENETPVPIKFEKDGTYKWKTSYPHVLVYDYGIKWNILRLLVSYEMELLVVPPNFSFENVKKVNPAGIFLSNGPGDPATLTNEISIIKQLCDAFPIAGICLGHQLLALALGGKTKKMKFGHHGANHPVKDLATGKISISSQNHGFCVMDQNIIPTHINLNDGTVEGFKHSTKPIMSVQHHPEAAAGPNDCKYFINNFRKMILK